MTTENRKLQWRKQRKRRHEELKKQGFISYSVMIKSAWREQLNNTLKALRQADSLASK